MGVVSKLMSELNNLIDVLETFNHDVTQFSFRCEDMQREASLLQAAFIEGLSSYKQCGYHLQNELSKSTSIFEKLKNDEVSLQKKKNDNRAYIDNVTEVSNDNFKSIQDLLNQWQKKKDEIIHNVEIAEQKQRQAENQYNFAYNQLETAIAHHTSLQAQLTVQVSNYYVDNNGWKHHRDPKRLAFLQSATIQANIDVEVAKKNKAGALNYLRICNEHLAKERNKLDICMHNVNIMTASYRKSQEATSSAESANSNAHEAESLMSKIAQCLEQKVSVTFHEKIKCIEDTNEIISKSDAKADESSEKKQKTDCLIEEYMDLVAMASSKLDERTDLLEEFNHTENIV